MLGLAVGLAVAASAGCGGGGNKGPAAKDYQAPLTELGQALKTTAADRLPPPAKLAEFERIEPMAPTASTLVRSGELVYLWGAGYDPAGTKVVAFEKSAEGEGGWVLLQDGSVKRMTAAELRAAPRAGK